jgi:hypothetical protein
MEIYRHSDTRYSRASTDNRHSILLRNSQTTIELTVETSSKLCVECCQSWKLGKLEIVFWFSKFLLVLILLYINTENVLYLLNIEFILIHSGQWVVLEPNWNPKYTWSLKYIVSICCNAIPIVSATKISIPIFWIWAHYYQYKKKLNQIKYKKKSLSIGPAANQRELWG